MAARRSAHSSRSNERYRSATAKTYARPMPPTQAARKLLGAWYTPPELVDTVVDNVLRGFRPAARAAVCACSTRHVATDASCSRSRDGSPRSVSPSSSLAATSTASRSPRSPASVRTIEDDALAHDWADETFDIVIGNPPFLSQMAAATTRGGASRHGGGPYADAAVEFLALAVRSGAAGRRSRRARAAAVDRRGTRRGAGPRRGGAHGGSHMVVVGAAPAPLRRRRQRLRARASSGRRGTPPTSPWTGVVTDRLGIPALDRSRLACAGTLGDRAELNANFRDEYYALVPAVQRGRRRAPVGHERVDRSRCLPVGTAADDVRAPHVHTPARRPRAADRPLPAVGGAQAGPQGARRQPDPDPRGGRRPAGAWLPGVPVNTVTPAGVDQRPSTRSPPC